MDIIYLLILLAAYLSGSISTAILVCRLLLLPDPRIKGSNNPGATNVHRIGGIKAAVLTLLGDILKTAIPVNLALWLNYSNIEACWVGVSSLLGHCFPIYYRFKGGKGVASMIAVLLFVAPRLITLAVISWLIMAWSFQRASVASIMMAIIILTFAYQFYTSLFLPLLMLSMVVIFRHKKNIINIIQGKEPLFGNKK